MTFPIHAMRIPGRWREGYVLDYHTRKSDFVGYDEYGHPRFDTVRTEIGEALYRLKYGQQQQALRELVAISAEFIRKWNPPVECVIPVPPSRLRPKQPVVQFAAGLAGALHLPFLAVVRKLRSPKQLKNVFNYDERARLLEDAFGVATAPVCGKSVLLVDDLYRSGATLNAVTNALVDKGQVSAVYVFAATRTRSAS